METLGLVAAVALACWAMSATLRWVIEDDPPRLVRAVGAAWSALGVGRPARSGADPVLLELELARIAERLQAEYFSDQPAKAERVRCWTLAYDRVLIELCESCSLDPPRPVPPLSAAERFTVEHTLVGSGRSW